MEVEFNDITLKNGKTIEFKDAERLLNEAADVHWEGKALCDKLNLENKKLKEFCRTLLEKNESDKKLVEGCQKECAFVLEKAIKLSEEKEKKPGWKFFKQDDDLVCDINFSDEESDDEEATPPGSPSEYTPIKQRGRKWLFNKNFELYDENLHFIKKFDSKFKLIAHFHPKNKF